MILCARFLWRNKMRKLFLTAAFLLPFMVGDGYAQPLATEISFTSPCTKGVRVFDKSTQSIACGTLQTSGAGYVIEMASDIGTKAQCPRGYEFIGHVNNSAMGGNVQHFACAKS
jgi:hypothetical protein